MLVDRGPTVPAARDDRAALLVAVSRALHQAGLASDGLEDEIRALAHALGVAVQINALPTTLTLAIGPPFAQQLVVLRLEPGILNLRKLALLDRLVREVRAGAEPGEALARVGAIGAEVPPDPAAWTIGTYALLSCGTALVLGGGRGEIIVSGVVGLAVGAIAAIAARRPGVDRIFEIAGAFVATLIVAAWERFVGPVSLYVALIAGIITLLPGYSLTTALAELANRNLVSGTSRLGGVMVTLLSLASGFTLGAAIAGAAIANAPAIAERAGWAASLGGALVMGLAIASLLHARYRDLGWIVAACVLTAALARAFPLLGLTEATPFATAFAIGLATNFAPLLRVPTQVVLVPALLVIVPGSLSYESLLYVLRADPSDGISLAVRSLLAAILIVAGFLTSQLLAPRRGFAPMR